MQFVNEKVKVLDTMKDKTFDRAGVFEKMGVWPEQIVDYLSMVGDSSDNIPGMRGIGAKGAAKLLAEYNTLENIRKSIDENLNKFENFSSEEIVSQRINKFLQIGRDKGFPHKPEMDSGLSIKNKNFYDWIKNIFYNKIYISGVIIFLLLIIGLIYFL